MKHSIYSRTNAKTALNRYDAILSPTFMTRRPKRCDAKSTSSLTRVNLICILISGDIQLNPGPCKRIPKYPCTVCHKAVTARSKAISCDGCDCERWTHIKCTGTITDKKYDALIHGDEEIAFLCNSCLWNELPQHTDEDDEPNNSGSTSQSQQDEESPADSIRNIFPRKGTHFIHINARSLRHKICDLTVISDQIRPAIIAVTETWFDPTFSDAETSIPGYKIVRKDRISTGGGVCIYIREDITFNPRPDLETSLEATWIDILMKHTKPVLVGCVYRPPNQTDFMQTFKETIQGLSPESDTIILGDINIDILNRNNSSTKLYKNFLKNNGLSQIISEPTRISQNSNSLIDHIIVSNPINIIKCGVIPVGFSDHCMTFCTRKINRTCINMHNFVKLRSLKNYTSEKLSQLIYAQNWDKVYSGQNVNDAWLNFESLFKAIIGKVAPEKHCRIKVRTQPWISNEILESMKLRDKCLKKYNHNKSESNLAEFRKLRNKTQQLVRDAKADYISNEIEKNKNDSKKLWKSLKCLGYENKPKTREHIILKINDEVNHDPVTIANHINDFFINVAHRLTVNLPPIIDLFSAFSDSCRQFYQSKGITPGAYTLQEVSKDYINKELKNIKASKGTGLDGISPRFLKDGADALTDIVTYLVNLSIRDKIVPDCAKAAKVTPLHKKNSKLEVGNYRPVSVLTSLSKILEKAVFAQANNWCATHNLLYHLQSGFRGNYSTDTCLIYLHDVIRKDISNGKIVGVAMIDVQKAFDSVDHIHLCEKIRLAGLDPTWFASYLSNRKQMVFVSDIKSDEATIKAGVPQGSILGPWFYLLYSNDMPTCIKDSKSSMILYADDTILMTSGTDIEEVKCTLTSALSKCHHWFSNNKLVMHSGKTETILLTSRRKKHLISNFILKHQGNEIKPSENIKYLGLNIDCLLSGNNIVDNIVKKCNARLKFLARHKNVLKLDCRKKLTSALIQCHFDYASTAWFFSLPKHLEKKLHIAQNKMVRFILNLHPRTHIGQSELDRVNLLSVRDRARQLMLNHMYNVYNGTAPTYLCEQFQILVRSYNTRYSQHCFVNKHNHGMAANNFTTVGTKEWNSLPDSIKCIQSKDSFKANIKKLLRSQAHLKEQNDFIY